MSQSPTIDFLTSELNKAKDDTTRINILHDLAFEYWNFDVEKAYELSLESLELSETIGYNKGTAWAYTDMGLYHYFKGDYNQALAFYYKSINSLDGEVYDELPSYTITRIANLYRDQSQYDSALFFYHEAIKSLPKNSEDVGNTRSIQFNMGISFLEMEMYDSARHYLTQSLKSSIKVEDSLLLALVLKEIGRLFLKDAEYDSSEYYLKKAKKIGDQLNLPEVKIFYAIHMSQLELEKGDYFKAIESIKSSLNLLNEYDFKQLRVKSLYLLGEIYLEVGQYDGAIDNLLKAESLNRQLSNSKQEAEINFVLGYAFYYQKNLNKAIQEANEAKNTFQEIGLVRQVAKTNNLLGLIALSQKEYGRAANYFDMSMATYDSLNYKKGIASILYNKSYIFLEQGQTQKVLNIQKRALAIEEEIENMRGIIISFNSLGDIYTIAKKYDSAEFYLSKAQELLTEHPSIAYEQENNLYLSNLYFAKSDYQKAYEYLRLSKQNSDSMFSVASLNKSLQLAAIHDIEKKEIEIANLNKDKKIKNSELAFQEGRLKQQKNLIYLGGFILLFFFGLSYFLIRTINKLKTTQQELVKAEKRASMSILISGLGHEINNPLNFIYGGVEALKKTKKDWTEKQSTFLNAIDEGISRTSYILNILNQFQKEKETEYAKCHLKTILEECIEGMQSEIPNSIKIALESNEKAAAVLGNEEELKRLFKELMKNSVQSIEKEGKISVTLSTSSSASIVTIKDDGAGINKRDLKLLDNLFYTTKDPNMGKGLGLYLVDYILHEHNGKINFKSTKGKGTIVTVTLPK